MGTVTKKGLTKATASVEKNLATTDRGGMASTATAADPERRVKITVPRNPMYNDVANATVTLLQKGGRGVLVNSNLIITAAHCIDFNCEGGMVLGDNFIEEIKAGEEELKVAPLAVEPVSDIAVLGALDNQTFFQEVDDFERFCERTKPVPLCRSNFERFQEFRVHIYNHKGAWVTGKAMQCTKEAKELFVDSDEMIEGGTSGGPIINDSGELVGITSNFSTTCIEHAYTGQTPRPHLALPAWVCRRIFDEQEG